MGLLRRNQGEQRTKYVMRERMLSIGDDYWIENDAGTKAYRVDGKALRFRDTWILEDPGGVEVARIREKKLSVRDAITIEYGGRNATVKKALIGIRDRFHVEVDGGQDMKIRGNIVDHEYKIEADGDEVAEVSKKWFRMRDTYGVEVDPNANQALILAVTVALDALAHDRG